MILNHTLRRTFFALVVAAVVPACGSKSSERPAQTDEAEVETVEENDPADPFATLDDNAEPAAAESSEQAVELDPEFSMKDEPADAPETATPADTGVGTTSQALSTTTSSTVRFYNVRGERVVARWYLPSGTSTTQHPAVLMLHGSGGLHKMPTSDDLAAGRICSPYMESQFRRWVSRLTNAGYAVLLPDSWQTRGYCDESGDSRRSRAYPYNSYDTNGKTRRLLARIYDTDASARWLCNHARVRCDSIAMVGFSNGGSAVMTALHRDLNGMLSRFASTTRGRSLNVSIPQLPSLFNYKFGVAYYPGCGFDHILTTTTDTSRLWEFYYPRKPLRIMMGSRDSLLEHCSVQAVGQREIQADTYADVKGITDRYGIRVFGSAEHGYDNAGCEKSGADWSDPNIIACDSSRKTTMSLLSTLPR